MLAPDVRRSRQYLASQGSEPAPGAAENAAKANIATVGNPPLSLIHSLPSLTFTPDPPSLIHSGLGALGALSFTAPFPSSHSQPPPLPLSFTASSPPSLIHRLVRRRARRHARREAEPYTISQRLPP